MRASAIRLAHGSRPHSDRPDRTLGSQDDKRSSAAPVGGILFDVADVFYDASLWRRWLWRLVVRLNIPAGFPEFFRPWDERYLPDVCCGRREYTEALQAFLLAAGLTWAQVDEIEAACRIQRRNLESNVRLLPGVVKTIAQIAPLGLRLAAWSDVPFSGAKLGERLERLGLGQRFAAVISSFDLEAAQPSSVCYSAAATALNLTPVQLAYVGHDAEHLAGAKSAGLTTIAFNYQRHAHADFYLAQFEDLLPLARAWSRPQHESDLAEPAFRSTATSAAAQGHHP
jgi:FMN phosphatase YigB (HAD superfamily)